ncbi:hypothetical protein J4464_00525 [Candidatus Woesearchaeota archaeon]|nr:hypothetical protein [Candidatus Woesearchaeota archaeon]
MRMHALLMGFGLVAGCARYESSQPDAHGPVIVGYSGLSSNLMDDILPYVAQRLNAVHVDGGMWYDGHKAQELRQLYNQGHAILIIGHSEGCRNALSLAYELQDIPVHLCFLDFAQMRIADRLGVGHPPAVPRNVESVTNVYSDGFLRGRPMLQGDAQGTPVIMNLSTEGSHWVFDNDPVMERYTETLNRLISREE